MDHKPGAQWTITRDGRPGTLSLNAEGFSLDVGADADFIAWERVQRLSFPTAFSVLIEVVDTPSLALGFASTGQQREFRSAMETYETRAAAAGADVDLPRLVARPADVLVLTLPSVPGHEVAQVLGLVTASAVVSRNIFSDVGSQLKNVVGGRLRGVEKAVDSGLQQATAELTAAARALGANAVIGASIAIAPINDNGNTGSAELILLSGTAVISQPVAETSRAADEGSVLEL